MIYLDTCIVIYAVEDGGLRGRRVREAMADTSDTFVVSPLALHEVLVGPMKTDDAELRDRYTQVCSGMRQVDMGADVFIRAAEIRARSGLRVPDSLHLAAAQLNECTALWTNDQRFAKSSRGLAVDILDGA